MINHKYKYAYLGAGKCGSSTISNALKKITYTENENKPNQHSTLLLIWKKYKGFEENLKLDIVNSPNNNIIPNDYFTFTFCRNPYSRILSAWQEFKKPNRFLSHKKKLDSKHLFESNGLSVKNVCGDFRAFVKYITIVQHIHWCQFNLIRKVVKIDYIGKMENLQEDFNVICDKIGIQQQKLKCKNKSKHKHYTEYYDDETRQIVAEKYAKDIEYFGYEFGE